MARTAVPEPTYEDDIQEESVSVATRLAEEALRDARAYQDSLSSDMPTSARPQLGKHLAFWKMCTRGLPGSVHGSKQCAKYGHRNRQGWVIIGPSTIGPGGRDQCAEFQAVLHAESLEEKYGSWPVGQVGEKGSLRHWALRSDQPYGPWERLVVNDTAGGLGEFPLSQFLQNGWHKIPALLKHRKDAQEWIGDGNQFRCEFCVDREFFAVDSLEAHRSAMHQEQRQGLANAREFGKAMLPLQESLERMAAGGAGGDQQALLELVLEQQRQITQLLAAQNAKN